MKRKFLEDLGLEKEVVDKIMDVNGTDIEDAKGDLTTVKEELEQTKTQLAEANTTIDGFKDYDSVKEQVSEYKEKYEQSKGEYEEKIADMQFTSILGAAITASGARSTKAVQALLDIESLKKSKDQTADIKAAIESCQKDNDFLFGEGEPIQNPVAPTGGAVVGLTKEEFGKMGYKERLELKLKNKAKYDELSGKDE